MRLLAIIFALSVALAKPAAANSQPSLPQEADGIPIILLVDLTSGQTLFERDADRRFVPASITKVMTAFTAFEMLKNGELDASERFHIRSTTFNEWQRKGSTMFLPADALVSVEQLLRGITTVSANDASIVLAEGASGSVSNWVLQMNANARRIGMRDSNFGTPNGWPDRGQTFVTARDLVKLGRALIDNHPGFYAKYFGNQELTYAGITQSNHNPLLGQVAGADGIKTGFTNQAGYGLLGSAERDGRRLILVIAGTHSERKRNQAARALIEWGFSAFELKSLAQMNVPIFSAAVQDGSVNELDLIGEHPFVVTIPANDDPAIRFRIYYDGPLRAPIVAGTKVAELEFDVAGMPKSRIPLFAEADVEQAGFLRRIWNGLIGWIT